MNPSPATRALSIVLALSLLAVGSVAAAWHLDLTDSYPKADQVLSEPPDAIRLWFNEIPELSLASIRLEGANSTIETGKPRATDDPKSFQADVLAQLEPGAYRVIWRAAGSDGHAIRGRYAFEVSAGAQMDR